MAPAVKNPQHSAGNQTDPAGPGVGFNRRLAAGIAGSKKKACIKEDLYYANV